MISKDSVQQYQQSLLEGDDRDAALRDRQTPGYARLQSRLSSYKTYQEKTTLAEKDLPAYDIGDFHMQVLNDRGPESLTIDDIQRDNAYSRNNVLNAREYGQRSNLSPFLNEVQLYETQKDYRGTENIPSDALRAQMFLSKADFYRAGLYVDDIGHQLTEQVSDFERRELNWDQQSQQSKYRIIFDDEKINYNTMAGAINPRTTQNAIDAAIQKYTSLKDQDINEQRYTIKQKTYNEIHDNRLNYQNTPDHTLPVADYSQVFITNPGKMPLNLLYNTSRQGKLDKEQYEAQQEEFNRNNKCEEIRQLIRESIKPIDQQHRIKRTEQDMPQHQSLGTYVINKIKSLPKKILRFNQCEKRPINQYFELLITLKRTQKELCNSYYNRLQCVSDQMKVLNLDSNLIYKLPHQIDHKAVAELQVIEDFLVIQREAPIQRTTKQQVNNNLRQQTQFDQTLSILVDKYLSNVKQIPHHIMQQIAKLQEQSQDSKDHSLQANRSSLKQSLYNILNIFRPEVQQQIQQEKQQLSFKQRFNNPTEDRMHQQATALFVNNNQDPTQNRAVKNINYSNIQKKTDLNPQSFAYDKITNRYDPVSQNTVNPIIIEGNLTHTRVPQFVNLNSRFDRQEENILSVDN